MDRDMKPIIFSGEMVRAILDGSKTMTRRVVKPQPNGDGISDDVYPIEYGYAWRGTDGDVWQCPYGVPGDQLYVREAWYSRPEQRSKECLGYVADGDHPHGMTYRKRPSIHMPRTASRITLEVTNVRVERLNEITEEDAIAEGVEFADVIDTDFPRIAGSSSKKIMHVRYNPVALFEELWDSINERRGFSWESNPFVWVIEFRRIKP